MERHGFPQPSFHSTSNVIDPCWIRPNLAFHLSGKWDSDKVLLLVLSFIKGLQSNTAKESLMLPSALAASLSLINSEWNNASLSWKSCAWGLQDRLIATGWCPSLLSELVAVDNLYTAYTQGRPIIPADHVGRQCNSRICNVNKIDDSTYMTKHVVDGCQCNFIGPPIDDIVSSLRQGFVPIVEVREVDNGLIVRVTQTVN
ncbi:hypothetical protein G7Y89_g15061 [Cudoniella acicularis]|uniref:Uncharacterized protein n=1 Tax=Cudoniella acicularis TaxID=354080 RepID=A0A8H4QUH4_9HELO|nr:hypothetical protein G7Y89_g15061 [Cudoniella acicularis]